MMNGDELPLAQPVRDLGYPLDFARITFF